MPDALLAYCDESGQRDYGPKTDPYFVVTGAIVKATDATHLEDELRGLKRTFWGAPEVELKSNWLRQPKERDKHYTSVYGITTKEIDELITAIYRWMHRVPIVLLAGIVDKPAMQAKYASPHYSGGVAYNMFLQRYQKVLTKRGATGSVVFDDPAGKSPGGHEWRALLQRQHSILKKNGCPYTKAPFPDVGALTFADSAASPFIQLADLAAYNTFRQFRDYGSQYDDPACTGWPLYSHFEKVIRLFDTGPGNVFSGFGVAKWPLRKRAQWCTPK